jgi:hypothetical protein
MSEELREEYIVEEQKPTGDAEKGALIGGVGGLVTGALAGAVTGPAGAVIGAVIGGVVGAAASGAAVAAVDRIDDDTTISGLPDDMGLDSVADREPILIDRDEYRRQNPPPIASETPIGVGMPEAVALAAATNPSEMASSEPVVPITRPELLNDGTISGDSQAPGTTNATNRTIDGGWNQNEDANQIDVNSAGAKVNESFPYADNPEDDRREGQV